MTPDERERLRAEVCAARRSVLQADGLLGQLLAAVEAPAIAAVKPSRQLLEQLDDAHARLGALLGQLSEMQRSGEW